MFLFITIILLSLLHALKSQGCLNYQGLPVDWWAALKVPPKIGKSGFGYYDSTYIRSEFNYIPSHID